MINLKRLKRLIKKPKKKNHLQNPPKGRKDVKNIKIQNDVFLQVYWKVMEIGKGPAVILYIFGKGVLRFDCFGKEKGHYHVDCYKLNGTVGNRIYFQEDNAHEQIERTVLELKSNLSYYLQKNKDQRIRDIKIEQKNMEVALVPVKSKMVEFLRTKPELNGI